MKFKTRFITASVLSLTLSACSTTPPTAPHQQNLLTRCPETLPHITDGTGGDVALTMNAWAAEYHRCATRHNGLVESITGDT